MLKSNGAFSAVRCIYGGCPHLEGSVKGGSTVYYTSMSFSIIRPITKEELNTIWEKNNKRSQYYNNIFLRLASLGGGPQAHVHMEGMKCRVLYLNVLGMNALFL